MGIYNLQLVLNILESMYHVMRKVVETSNTEHSSGQGYKRNKQKVAVNITFHFHKLLIIIVPKNVAVTRHQGVII